MKTASRFGMKCGTMRTSMKTGLLVSVLMCGVTYANLPGAISTDRFGYTGVVKRYDSLTDAQNGNNQVGSDTNIGSRDLAIYIVNGIPSVNPINQNIIMGSWWYTTADNTNGYPKGSPDGDLYESGYGNVNGNSGVGFVQLYDTNSSTDTSIAMDFTDFNGTNWTTFNLDITGVNATATDDFARFWVDFQGSGADKVVYDEYELQLTAGGLNGTQNAGLIEATNHPTSVTGTYSGIFHNVSTTYPQNNGYYTFSLNLDMNNWAYANSADLNGAFSPSYFAVAVPVPGAGALCFLGLGFVGWVKRRVG